MFQIIQERVNKCVFPRNKTFQIKTYQTFSHDKLINQASYQYTTQSTLVINKQQMLTRLLTV